MRIFGARIMLAAAVFLISLSATASQLSDEKRLIKHLLNNYENVGLVGRPVYNTSETVHLSFGLALIQIMGLDEANQVLSTNIWERYLWKDILLRWTPEDFGGVDHVRVPADKIWTPDLVLYNYADSRVGDVRNDDAMAVISSDGTVLWIPRAILKSTCSVDMTFFPFDEQTCHLKFGSWTYDGFKLDVNFYDSLKEVDVSDYVENNEWGLIRHPAKKNVKYYPCCEEPYPDLTFTLNIKRITAFYNYILILPCALLTILMLVIFWMPPESPSKVILGATIFVSFFLLLMILSSVAPPTAATIPLIVVLICLNMILITISMILTTVTANISSKRTKVPGVLSKLVNVCAKCLCITATEPASSDHPELMASGDEKTHTEDASSASAEWRKVAMVVDRICFIIYLIIICISFMYFLIRT